MRTGLGTWCFGVTFIGLLAVAACVEDKTADVVPPGPDSGTSDAGSSGTSGTSGTGTSGEVPDGGDAGDVDGGDAGPTGCAVNPTPFPCGPEEAPNACYGDVQSCSLTGCGGANDFIWSCTVASDCSRSGGGTDGLVCCLPGSVATVTPGAGCTPGTLTFSATSGLATTCSLGTCADGAAMLCGTDEDCPETQHCKPLAITNGGASIKGNRVGVCTP